MTRGRYGKKSQHLFGNPPQRLVLGIEGFERRAPLLVPPLDELAGRRPFKAVDLNSQSGVPGDLPPPPQAVLQAYLILNASRNRRPWIGAGSTLGKCQPLAAHAAFIKGHVLFIAPEGQQAAAWGGPTVIFII